ncbi:uncharacterized protein EV420DRAFT_1539194 [Desarmillaria tabescens]|uniref:BTB domain-containing protein n=1 Tax=Armillaria tabescens TaxID=1929756 RepID=A0AA39KEE0_ARMTA|nr:uncharacterized protein EV420DRAFT_1539194 [Desarmillaria tabescens]KAK0459263.1 hypothetical protein EV420DRAFT_1539194 [Desarmillaria tabescens]
MLVPQPDIPQVPLPAPVIVHVRSRRSSRSSRTSRSRSRSRSRSPCHIIEAPENPGATELFYRPNPLPMTHLSDLVYSSSSESRSSSPTRSSRSFPSHFGLPTSNVVLPAQDPSKQRIPCLIPVPIPPQTDSESGRSDSCSRSRSRGRSPRPEISQACAPIVIGRSRSRSRTRSVSPCRYPQAIYSNWPHPAVSRPRYYFQDGNVTLEIDRTQYKIHRHFLVTNSPVFAKELPPHITYKLLTSVDKEAFELVLSLFYPKDCFSGHDIQSESDWRKVLVFACRYNMKVIRNMALTKVPTLDPIEKAHLATKYGLKDWLVPAYVDLCMKDLTSRSGWSVEEGMKIGLEGLLALADVKRDILKNLEEYLDRDKVLKTVEMKLETSKLI